MNSFDGAYTCHDYVKGLTMNISHASVANLFFLSLVILQRKRVLIIPLFLF